MIRLASTLFGFIANRMGPSGVGMSSFNFKGTTVSGLRYLSKVHLASVLCFGLQQEDAQRG